jgi:hypothetical protein
MQTKRKNRKLRRFWPAALWILATPGLSPAADFNAPRGFQVGYSAALAVADLNGDGNPDLVSADEYSNNVSILLGKGDGGFRPAIDYAVGAKVGAVVVGDFNGDGKLDLAVASLTPHTISILFGNGDGTFQPAIVSIQGLSVFAASSLVVGDFNGDGKLDLAAGAIFAGNFEGVAIFLGNGDGTFNRKGTYAFEQPATLAVADFNGDGKPDLAVGFVNGATVLLGNGNGTFHPSASFDFGYDSLAVADFNSDGKPDLVLIGSAITVLLGKGDGSFQPPLTYPLAGYGVVVGDFNGDGKPDLAVSSTNTAGNISGTLSILLGLGNGTFQPLGTYSVSSALPVVADFNRDGALDLAVGDGAAALILLGNGQGGFEHPSNYKAGIKNPTAVATGDFDGDGKQDLAVVNSVSQTVSVILASGQTHNYSLPFVPESLAVGDFNLDGKLDLAVGFAILLGNGDGTFQLTANYGPATSVVVGDFNGDGKPDLAGIAGGSGKLLLGNGDGTFQPPRTAGDVAVYQAAGDFNGDGKSDLAVLSNYYSTYTLSVLLSHADGTFEVGSAFVFDAPAAPTSVAVGDFNGDGKLDLAVSIWSTESVSIYLGNGDGTFQPPVSYDAGGGEPELAVVADFNADGKQDIAVYSYGSHSVFILAGRGDGTFTPQPVSFEACAFPLLSSQLTPQGMAVLDFNGDGKPDLALVNYSLDSVIVLTNTTP